MKNFTLITKIYLIGTLLMGIFLLVWRINTISFELPNLIMLAGLTIAASLAQILKVEGTTSRSHFAISFVVYGFSFMYMPLPETLLVILVANVIQWMVQRKRTPWYIASFNGACYIIVMQIAHVIYFAINPTGEMQTWMAVIAIVGSMISFTLLNHLMVGIIIWLARGENFSKSGMFDFMPLMMDFTMLVLGASLYLVWNFNPFAVFLFLIPLYLIYSTLRVPALERQTEIDTKTGLYNHNYFMNQLESEFSRANRFNRPLALVMSDLDLLRNINNTFGHLAGDEVLMGVARILQKSVRDYDLVARFGGEEFAIMMPEINLDAAFDRAEEIRRAIESAEFTVPTSVTPIRVTISIGVAGREQFIRTKEEIIHNADAALYNSKLDGRNRTTRYIDGGFENYKTETASTAAPEGSSRLESHAGEDVNYAASYTRYQPTTPSSQTREVGEAYSELTGKEEEQVHPESRTEPARKPVSVVDRRNTEKRINIFIGVLGVVALALFIGFFQPLPVTDYLGLAVFAGIVLLTEWFSIDIYARETAVSTSAAPLLGGILLFGPTGAFVLSLVFALTAYAKSRGPYSRILFNFSNQMIPTMLALAALQIGKPYVELPILFQAAICLVAMILLYAITTILVSVGMSLSSGTAVWRTWEEHFSWLAPFYIVMGLMAYALIFGYYEVNILGVFMILAPLLILRWSQKQFIDRTRAVVMELREKNVSLERSSTEISKLSEGLLEMLGGALDLHDEYVLGHSKQVTELAVTLAKSYGLNKQRIEIVRKTSILHDIGKLGITERILGKQGRLSFEEYDLMKKHSVYGSELLMKSSSLRNLAPLVRHHHERFDGNGYPDGLRGMDIPLESRIVAVADAIEAMSSNRIYRHAIAIPDIIKELKRNSNSQFDPQIAALAVHLLENGTIVLP